jgi:peptidoglycan/LPS O-acetylase OafA/YrhL
MAETTAAKPSFVALDLLDNRYPALHGLRVLGIVSVVQFHVTWIFAGEQGITLDHEWVASSLAVFFGMDLFFMLSGFLIGSILLRSIETSGTQNIRRFYIRRVFRTFPSYYVVLLFLIATSTLYPAQKAHLPYEFAYLTNFMPLGRTDVIMFWGWSLGLEEQFYLAVPLLFWLLYRLRDDRARLVMLGLLWASALGVRLYIFLRYGPWTDFTLYGALYFRTITRFDTLVAGIILAVVHQRFREPVARFLAEPRRRAILALPALACLWVLLRPWMFGVQYVQLVHVFAWGTITTLMYFATLLLLLNGDGWFQRWLGAPIFRRVATLGYGVYLVHIPICDRVIVPIAHRLDARHVSKLVLWPASLVVLLALSLALAYVMHVVIEKPSLRIREWLAA